MSWAYDGEYANGADGSCVECGAATDEPYHLYCASCYRVEMGWDDERDDDELEEDLDRIDNVLPLREECPSCGELRVLFPSLDGRECLDCKGAHR
jgi:hypothetical protein